MIYRKTREYVQILDALKFLDFTLVGRLITKHIIGAKEEILNNFKELKK